MSAVSAKKASAPKTQNFSFSEWFFNPESAFMVLMIVVCLLPLASGRFFGFSWSNAVDLAPRIFVLSFGVALVSLMYTGSLLKHQIEARLSKVFWLFAGFLSLVFISSLTAISPLAGVFGGIDNPFGFLTYLCLVALFILTTQLVTGKKRLMLLSKVIVYSYTVVAIIAWIQRIFNWSPITGHTFASIGTEAYRLTRGYGTLGNPDFLGHALLLPALLALALFSFSDTAKMKRIFGGCFFIITGALIGTSTRGAIIALLIAAAFFIIVSAVKRYPVRSALVLLIGTLVISVLIALPISARSQDYFLNRFIPGIVQTQSINTGASGEGSRDVVTAGFGGRIGMWEILLESIKDRPLQGAGPANTLNAWRLHRTAASLAVGSAVIMTDAHNLILELSVTLGIPATLFALALFVVILARAVKTDLGAPAQANASSLPAGRIMHLGWTAGLVAFMISAITAMNTITWFALLFLNLAVSLSPHVKTFDLKYPLQRQQGFINLASAGGILIALVVGIFGTLYFVSNVVGASAVRSADPLGRLELATRIAPFDLVQKENLADRYLNLGRSPEIDSNQRLGAVNRAIEIQKEVVAVAPRTFDPYYGLALGHYIRSEMTLDTVDVAIGHDFGHKGLRLYPAALILRASMATAYNDAGRYQEAYDVLDGWVGIDKLNSDAEEQFAIASQNLNGN